MRAIIALALIALLMGLAGWLTIGSRPDRTSINIETDEIQRDTKNAVEEAEELIESGARIITGDENAASSNNLDRNVDPEAAGAGGTELEEGPTTIIPSEVPAPTSPPVTP